MTKFPGNDMVRAGGVTAATEGAHQFTIGIVASQAAAEDIDAADSPADHRIAARAEALLRAATPDQARDIEAARQRLTAPDQMGALFKTLALTHPTLGAPAGFD